MNNCAQETTDVLIAADGLPTDSLMVMISAYANLANNQANYTPAERELHHSILRLLCRVRDIHAERWRALKRADNQAKLLKDSTTNAALKDAFDSLVNN